MTLMQDSAICNNESPTTAEKSPRLHTFLRAMAKKNASDLHFQANCTPHIRMRSKISPVRGKSLTGVEILEMVREILTDRQMKFFLENGSVDVSAQPRDCDRFRINIFRQRGEISIAVRGYRRRSPPSRNCIYPRPLSGLSSITPAWCW